MGGEHRAPADRFEQRGRSAADENNVSFAHRAHRDCVDAGAAFVDDPVFLSGSAPLTGLLGYATWVLQRAGGRASVETRLTGGGSSTGMSTSGLRQPDDRAAWMLDHFATAILPFDLLLHATGFGAGVLGYDVPRLA